MRSSLQLVCRAKITLILIILKRHVLAAKNLKFIFAFQPVSTGTKAGIMAHLHGEKEMGKCGQPYS